MKTRLSLGKSALTVSMVSGLLTGCFTVGSIGYVQPHESDEVASEEAVVAEHCFMLFPGSLDGAMQQFATKTNARSWDNVNLTFKQNFSNGCLQLKKFQGGK